MKLLLEHNPDPPQEIFEQVTQLIVKINPAECPELTDPAWFRLFVYNEQVIFRERWI